MNNRLAFFTLGLLLAAPLLFAQQPPSVAAAQWALQQKEALASIHDAAMAEQLKQGTPALEKLFAEYKTGGVSDPVACTRIAALTQYVMRPAGKSARKAYAAALLAAAQRATDADVTCFFLDQLRWCGLPHQAEPIKAFEKSSAPGVSALAAMTVQAVTDDRASKAAPVKDTACSALNKEIAALKPKARTARLLQIFDGPCAVQAGVALAWARTEGGKKETALWAAKLATAADPSRKIMLLDMLGERGDKTACGPVAGFLADTDDGVAAAAQRALIRLDAEVFAEHIPALLKDLPPTRQMLARDGIRQLKTDLLKNAVTKPYDTFSETGKRVALEIIKERRLTEAAPLGLAALDAKDEESVIAGYRLLREIASKEHADVLVAKTLATTGRVTPEAQTTLAAAARRDTTGAYAAVLAKTLAVLPDAQKPVALETAARLGGDALLKAVESASASANADIAVSAVRALAAWSDTAALPALLRLAVTAPDAKRQTLAVRGVSKMFNTQPVDKKALLPVWRTIRAQVGNEENKKTIDDLFKEQINVVLGKAVSTNVPTEGDNVPGNLVDGTLQKAWHAGKWPAQAQIDLGNVQTVSGAHVTFYYQDGRAYTFTLEVSADGKTWKQVAGNTDAVKPATAEGLSYSFADTPARYVRLNVLKNSANFAVHVLELKLFSNIAP